MSGKHSHFCSECGEIRKESNHWESVFTVPENPIDPENKNEIITGMMPFDMAEKRRKRKGETRYDYDGQMCIMKTVQRYWDTRKVKKPETAAELVAESQQEPEHRGSVTDEGVSDCAELPTAIE